MVSVEEPIAADLGRCRGRNWRLREVEPADEPYISQLLRGREEHRNIQVSQEIEPKDLLGLHLGRALRWVVETPNVPVAGYGACVIRTGHFAGQVRPVGYLSGVVFDERLRGGAVFPELSLSVLEHVRERWGCELFFALVPITSGRLVQALERANRGDRAQPRFHPLEPLQRVTLSLDRLPQCAEREVERLGDEDVYELAGFLSEENCDRLFADVYEANLLGRRFDAWPNFSLASFRAVRDRAGSIVASCAPWDMAPVRSFRVLGYSGPLGWLRHGMQGGPGPVKPGGLLRVAHLTHLEVEGGEPNVLGALLSSVGNDLAAEGYHVARFDVPAGSQMDRMLDDWPAIRELVMPYAVTLPDSSWTQMGYDMYDLGFECALA